MEKSSSLHLPHIMLNCLKAESFSLPSPLPSPFLVPLLFSSFHSLPSLVGDRSQDLAYGKNVLYTELLKTDFTLFCFEFPLNAH